MGNKTTPFQRKTIWILKFTQIRYLRKGISLTNHTACVCICVCECVCGRVCVLFHFHIHKLNETISTTDRNQTLEVVITEKSQILNTQGIHWKTQERHSTTLSMWWAGLVTLRKPHTIALILYAHISMQKFDLKKKKKETKWCKAEPH